MMKSKKAIITAETQRAQRNPIQFSCLFLCVSVYGRVLATAGYVSLEDLDF
jgi:hypothetical protein